MVQRSLLFLSSVLAIVGCGVSYAKACPFCTAQSQTLTEEMESMDAVVLAKLIEPPPPESNDPSAAVPKGKFEVMECFKGESLVQPTQKIEVLYYGDASVGSVFLAMAVVEGEKDKQQTLIWSTPLKASPRCREYLAKLSTLPKNGAERLDFFQKHLEDTEEILARDAYDEFAKAPYEEVIALKAKMNHDQLLSWIKNEEIPASRRRLYLTMLGVCGSEHDLPLLEEMIRSEDRSRRAGLDALLACFLTLKGEAGLALIEDLYFKNKKAEYSDVNSAIMALRFHGTDANVIPAKKIVPVFRLLLNRPELADLIIPDLARWEDWQSLDALVELFKSADTKSTWVREPIINFVRVCPLPAAKDKFLELEKIDPAAVKRASRYLPFGPPKPPADVKQTSQSLLPSGSKAELAAVNKSTAQVSVRRPNIASANSGAKPVAAALQKNAEPANHALLWSVSVSVGLLLLVVQWSLLKGGGK